MTKYLFLTGFTINAKHIVYIQHSRPNEYKIALNFNKPQFIIVNDPTDLKQVSDFFKEIA